MWNCPCAWTESHEPGALSYRQARRRRYRAVVAGCLFSAASGLVYVASLAFVAEPIASVWVVACGRVLLALGESLIATGSLGWALGLVGPGNAGKVIVWIGIAIYGAYALGAPLGVAVNEQWGFIGVAVAVIVIPLLALAAVARVRAVAPSATRRTPFYKVLGAVFWPGMGLALASVGFGLITAFIALLFVARDWGNASLAFTAFGLAFILARVFFGHLPDKLGGARVALASVAIEALGQLLIWAADTASTAYLGTALTGLGYSLAFPGFGVEAVRRAPPRPPWSSPGSWPSRVGQRRKTCGEGGLDALLPGRAGTPPAGRRQSGFIAP